LPDDDVLTVSDVAAGPVTGNSGTLRISPSVAAPGNGSWSGGFGAGGSSGWPSGGQAAAAGAAAVGPRSKPSVSFKAGPASQLVAIWKVMTSYLQVLMACVSTSSAVHSLAGTGRVCCDITCVSVTESGRERQGACACPARAAHVSHFIAMKSVCMSAVGTLVRSALFTWS
jgi:hypothetical protein